MSSTWQIGIAEGDCLPGTAVSTGVALAIVQAGTGGVFLVRALETVKNADLVRRAQHLCMDIGARYDATPTVRGPSQPGFCWGAEFVQCIQPDLERLRELLAAGTLRLPNGHESVRKAEKFVSPALPVDPPVTAFIETRGAILSGNDGGALAAALAAAICGLEPIPEPQAAPAPMPGYSTGPR